MFRSRLAFLALLLPGCTFAAHATTITAGTYVLENASVAGYAVTGTVTVNGTGAVTSSNLTMNAALFDNPGLPTFTSAPLTSAYNGLSQSYLTSPTGAGQLALIFNTTADANGFFNLCLASVQCGTSVGTIAPSGLQIYGFYNNTTRTSNAGLAATQFSSGYLRAGQTTPVAATPEPSSLLLLGTGVLGLGGVLRRQLRHHGVSLPFATA